MKYRKKLFQVKDPFAYEDTKDLFFRAMKENFNFQYEKIPEYKKIMDGMGFHPDLLEKYDDIEKIPFLPTLFFKKHILFSMPRRKIWVQATSSGTKGRVSVIGIEAGGLLCGLRMVLKTGRYRKLFSPIPVHYIVLGYRPHKENHTAVAKTAFGATLFAPALSRSYALQYVNGSYEADLEYVIRQIQQKSRSRFPMRFMGFPSYLYFILKTMEERGLYLKLPEGSKIMMGGGWKQFYAQQVDKQVLYDLAWKVLRVREENIIEFFGAVEHPVLYCDCPYHHFHVPAYGRVVIRDVNTLEPVANGELGLVNLLTPMIQAAPVLSVVTDDLGILHDAEECPCGLKSPWLEIIGRVGLKEIKTCAAGAAEKL